MCVYSQLGDHYGDQWKWVPTVAPNTTTGTFYYNWPPQITREEFDELKKQVEEAVELIKAAVKIDRITGQKDCQKDEKIEVVRRVLQLFDISLEELLGEKND